MAEDRARVEDRQDLRGLFTRMKRHVPVIVLCVLIATILAGVMTMFMPKRYTASAQLAYSPNQSVATPGSSNTLSDVQRDAEIEAQLQNVRSLPVAVQVVRTMNLTRDPELRAEATKLGGRVSNIDEAIGAVLLENVRARRVGQTPLFNLTYTDPSPVDAMNFANAFARSYIVHQRQQKIAQSAETQKRLDVRVAQLRQQAEAADAAMAAFRVRNNLLNTPDSTSLESEIANIQTDLATARAAAAEAGARNAAARQNTIPGGGVNGPVASNSNTLTQLRQQQAEVGRRAASLSSRYGPKHPLVLDSQQELASINAQIDSEMKNMAATAGSEVSAASSRAASLQASLRAAQARLARTVAASVQLADLQRQAQNAHQLYESMLASSGQEDAKRGLVQADARLDAPATLPLRASSPNLVLNLFLGMVAGLAIGLAIAYVRERWSQGLDTVDDIDRLLGQTFLNSVPTLASAIEKPKTKDPAEAVLVHPLSAYTEAFRNLATSLTYAAKAERGKVIGITSALPKEGKTTTSIAMGRVLSAAGSKVLIMDADLRRRSVTIAVAPQTEAGLIEVLSGKALIEDVLLQDPSGAFILPLAPQSHIGPMPFDTPTFDNLMQSIRQKFDVIIVDTAPVLAVTDTRMLLHHFDALALLTRWRATPVKAVRAAIHQIETVGGRIDGVALTMVNLKTQAQSGYGDASYYYGYMKDYYSTT